METAQLSRRQWGIVVVGWLTYAAIYLGRVNLATALPAIETDLGWLPSQTGLLAGAMLWTYGLGQLVNGWLGQRVDTRRMVFVGAVGSSIVNLLFASSSSFPVMIALWLVNGYLQSMAWGPILRMLSDHLTSSQRSRIAGAFGASYVVGSALTWVLSGLVLSVGGWRPVFIIPPLLMLGVGLVWYVLAPTTPPTYKQRPSMTLADAGLVVREAWTVLLAALVAGALINGALLYAPSYIAQTLPLDLAALTAIIFPIFGLMGTVWLSAWVLRRVHGNALRSLLVLLALAGGARALALVLPTATLSAVVLLAGMGVTSYALTNTLLTGVPLTTFAHLGTSLVAGMMDATHSLGGAVGSTLVGLLLSWGDWSLVFVVWSVLPLAAIVGIGLILRSQRTGRLRSEKGVV